MVYRYISELINVGSGGKPLTRYHEKIHELYSVVLSFQMHRSERENKEKMEDIKRTRPREPGNRAANLSRVALGTRM